MDWNKSYRILGGEVVVNPSGIYTFAHFYRHKIDRRSVVLVGTNHVGDAEYFRQISDILSPCDLVLFEDGGGQYVVQNEFEDLARAALKSSDLETAFTLALQLYFLSAQKVLRLPVEKSFFNYQQPGWIYGEKDFLTEEQQMMLMEELEARMQAIPIGRKKRMVEFVRQSLEKMDRGEYTALDLGEGFVFFWGDAQLAEAVLETIGKPRDRNCLEVFDAAVRERNPAIVGIKFGAGHTAYQRQLLEERGYVREARLMLRNIRF